MGYEDIILPTAEINKDNQTTVPPEAGRTS